MKIAKIGGQKLVAMVNALVIVSIGVGVAALLSACSTSSVGPAKEDTILEDSVNARLESQMPCGVYATSDGTVLVTFAVAKAALGGDEQATANAKSVVRRVLTELPQVKRVEVRDTNRQSIGTFLPNQ